MILRLTGFFLFVAVCLGLIGLWPETSHNPERERSWPAADLSGVDQIRLDGPAGYFELLRQSDGWRLRLPQRAELLRADAGAIEDLAAFVGSHKPLSRAVTDSSGTQPEVLAPRYRLAMSGSAPWELTVAAPGEGLAGLPARLSTDPGKTLVLSLDWVAHLERPAESYLDLRVFGPILARPSSLELTVGGQTAWVLRRSQTGWVFSGPPELSGQAADPEAVGAYLQAIGGLEAELPWLEVGPPESLPRLALTLHAGERSETLAVWSDPEGLGHCPARSSWQPSAFSLDRTWVDQVEKTAFALRERTILALDPGRVERMSLAEGRRRVELTRKDAAWTTTAASSARYGIDVLLWRLSRLAFAAVPRDGLPDGVGPSLSWDLFGAREERLASLAFAPDPRLPAGLVWCADLARGQAYPVGDDLYREALDLLPGRPAPDARGAS